MSEPDLDLLLAEEFVRHTGCHIFLTGRAGTGKTTFLHNLKHKTPKRMVVTAPTGVAAINAGGVTLHSFFQIPLGPFIPASEAHAQRHKIRREKIDIIRSIDLLVIDEISMVRSDVLDGVDSVLRRYRRSSQPFGGVQLLMIGDLCQLSPVVKNEEWQILQAYYESPYFFSSTALAQAEFVPIELKHVYRQSDRHFIELLNRVRENKFDQETLKQLNARYIPDFSPGEDEGYITLCTHNSRADAINNARLKSLPGKSRRFDAILEGDFPEQAYPTAAFLELKKGAQVMFIRNDMSAEKSYFNGKIGKITGMSDETIEVLCPGDAAGITVSKTTWENIEYTVDPETAVISQKVAGTFTQFPLKPAWAITIHKSQGLTFDKAVIDAKAAFAYGQVYVALSRCRTLEGIVLRSPLSPVGIKTEHTIQRFTTEAANNPPSPEKLEAAKSLYQQNLLNECFTFNRLRGLLGRFAALLRKNAGVIQAAGSEDIIDSEQRIAAEICEVGEKFKVQLQGMFSETGVPAENPAVQERVEKAAIYFQEKFEANLLSCLENFKLETDNKEIRKQIRDALKQLKEETATKLAGIVSCREGFSPGKYLHALSAASINQRESRPNVSTPTFSEADVGHPELFQELLQWRKKKAVDENLAPYQVIHQKTLVQIAVYLPDSIAALEKIKGIGKRLAAKYGLELTEMVKDYRRKYRIDTVSVPKPSTMSPEENTRTKTHVKEDTRKVSLELFKKGLTISRIAEHRGLAISTIESHLTHWVSNGELGIGDLLTDEKRCAIEKTITPRQGEPLSRLKAALGDDFSYGEIKLVLAHLEHLEKQ
ncbi:MAG TPA: helicase [Desulfobacteraceae bacterium]|nr:helicase [Desulfobacteraceae bacterium]